MGHLKPDNGEVEGVMHYCIGADFDGEYVAY